MSPTAFAQQVKDVPAQPLAMSLNSIAKQSGKNILFEERTVAGIEAPALKGPMEPQRAVEELLRGTNLEVSEDRTGTLLIRPKEARAPLARTALSHTQLKYRGWNRNQLEIAGITFGEVLVTARRRAESLQKVPIAISAFDAEALTAANVTSVDDLHFHVPSFVSAPGYFGASIPGLGIRGQHQDEALATLDGAVLLYFADMPLQRPHGAGLVLYDLESVQVLKGPQGTLFGKNTTGGAVLINPNRPELGVFTGAIGGSAGNYGLYTADGVINIPIGTKVALRAAGQLRHHNGYTTNLANGTKTDDEHSAFWRVSLRIQPTDNLDINTIYQGTRLDTHGISWKNDAVRVAGNPFTDLGVVRAWEAERVALQNADFHSIFSDQQLAERVDTWTLTNTIALELGNVTVKNIAGYREVNAFTAFDYDGSDIRYTVNGDNTSIFNSQDTVKGNQFSNEFQVSGDSFHDSLSWIAGVFYFREDNFDNQYSELLGRRTNTGKGINTSKSVFGSLTYRIPFLPRLSFTGGARYTFDERELLAANKIQDLGAPFVCRLEDASGNALNPCFRDLSTTFSAPSYTISVDYQLTDDILLYIVSRQGYRSGGWNLRSLNPANSVPFRPETVNDYEIGTKATFHIGDVGVRFNAAYYYQRYENIQRTVTAPIGPGGTLVTTILNAAQAKIQGLEAELKIKPTPNFEVSGFVGWTNTNYRRFNDTVVSTALVPVASEREFSYVPEITMGFTATYNFPLNRSIGDVSVSANWYRQDQMQSTTQNDGAGLFGLIPGYQLTNFYLDWKNIFERNVDARLFVKNAFDENYYTSGLTLYEASGLSTRNIGAPRTVGVELHYHFGDQ